jgi:hypothetical protein
MTLQYEYIKNFSECFDILNNMVDVECRLPMELKNYIWNIYKYEYERAMFTIGNFIFKQLRTCRDCKTIHNDSNKLIKLPLSQYCDSGWENHLYSYKRVCREGCVFNLNCGCKSTIQDPYNLMSNNINIICCNQNTRFDLCWSDKYCNEHVIHNHLL